MPQQLGTEAARLAAVAEQAEMDALKLSAVDIQAHFRANLARKATALQRAAATPDGGSGSNGQQKEQDQYLSMQIV